MTVAELYPRGLRVIVREGWGFTQGPYYEFKRAPVDLPGTVTAVDLGTIYVKLDDGRSISSNCSAIVPA